MGNGKDQAAGYLIAVVQAVLYSTLGIFGKLLYATGLDAQQVVVLRFLCATVLLGAFMLVWRKEPLISRQRAVYIQSAFFFGSAFLYFFGVERLNAGINTVLFYLFPIIVAAINLVVYHEKISKLTAAAMVLALMGLALISGITTGALVMDPVGIACALASALVFAIYTVLIQETGRTEGSFTVTFTISWVCLLISCIAFAPAVPAMFSLDLYQVAMGCAMALASTILPVVLYIQAVKRIGGTLSSLISISETPFSLILAFILLGETIDGMEAIGILFVVVSVVIVTAGPLIEERREKREESSQ